MLTRLPEDRHPIPALLAILGFYLLLGAVYGTVAPFFEKPDEEWHYAYIQHLLRDGTLPPISTDETLNPARQEAGQPPLFYAAASLVARLLRMDAETPSGARNPYWGYPARGTVADNKNRFIHLPGEIAQAQARSLFLLRGLSLLLGAGAVVSAYALARALGAGASVGLASAAFVATLPQYLFIASSVSNDALVASLAGAALWALVLALRPGERVGSWLVFGLLAGLASLTKTSALLLPLLGAGMAVLAGLRRRAARMGIVGVAASVGGVLICTGWWYIRNVLRYGDPLGLNIHFAEYGRTKPLAFASLAGQLQTIETSFWAAFGWGNVTLPPWVYLGLRGTSLLGVLGVIVILVKPTLRGKGVDRLGLWAMILFLAGVSTSLAIWTQAIAASLGRLLFPALAPLAALLALGWSRLWRRLPAIVVGITGIVAVAAPIYMARVYAPPPRLPDTAAPAGTRPIHLEYGGLARLYAFDVTPQRVLPGQEVDVKLCWQALSSTPTNYSVFVQLVGAADASAGRRGTYPGLGSYATTLWRPGDAFCDLYRVPVNADATGPGVYAIEVGLFGQEASDRLPAYDEAGNPVEFVSVGEIKIGGRGATVPAAATSVGADFAGRVTLLGYEVSAAHPGEELHLTLYWRADAPMATDYTVFVHVLDAAGSIVAQADAPPQAGRYPTHWWERGEALADQHTIHLPADLRPGAYRVRLGLYDPTTGERLPLAGAAGDAIDLGPISIAQ